MQILCLSDIHGEGAGLGEALSGSPDAEVVAIVGDLTHLGGAAEADKVLAPLIESGRRLLAVPGNMDGEGARRSLAEAGLSIHGRGVVVGGVGFMGLGGSNPTPFGTPFEIGGPEAQRLLADGLAGIAAAPFRVLLSHAPPRGTRLDKGFAGMHVGSPEVREFLLSGAVGLCLCGHIHEAAGEDTLGGALCVNVGPFKNGHCALIDITGAGARILWRK
jgi:Icc-related predicted phosphoesterase